MSKVFIRRGGHVKVLTKDIWDKDDNKQAWLKSGFKEMTKEEVSKYLKVELEVLKNNSTNRSIGNSDNQKSGNDNYKGANVKMPTVPKQ